MSAHVFLILLVSLLVQGVSNTPPPPDQRPQPIRPKLYLPPPVNQLATTPFLPPPTEPVHHGPLQPLPPIDLVGAADARLGAVRLEPESKYVIPGERPESFIFVPIPTHDYYRVPPMVDVVPKGIHPLPPYQIVRIRSSNIDRSRLDEILHSRLEDVHISMLYGPINDASDQRYRVILLPPRSTYRRLDGTKDIPIPEGQYFRVPLGAYAATPYVDICHEVADQIVRIVDARTLGHIHRLCEDRHRRLILNVPQRSYDPGRSVFGTHCTRIIFQRFAVRAEFPYALLPRLPRLPRKVV